MTPKKRLVLIAVTLVLVVSTAAVGMAALSPSDDPTPPPDPEDVGIVEESGAATTASSSSPTQTESPTQPPTPTETDTPTESDTPTETDKPTPTPTASSTPTWTKEEPDSTDSSTDDGTDGDSTSDGEQATDSTRFTDSKPSSNVTSRVVDLVDRAQSTADSTGTETVTVRINAKAGRGDSALSLAQRYGGDLRSRLGNRIVVDIPASTVMNVADAPAVDYVQTPDVARSTAGPIVSEGVQTISADDLHPKGINGSGVTVAVIDQEGAFNASNPEFADEVVDVKDMTNGETFTNGSGTGDHGSAVAETVVDVAPNVSLVLIEVEGSTEVANGIDYAYQSTPSDTIVMSLGFGQGPFDGSDFMGDHVADARQAGVPMFISAGNSADGEHLNLTWNDPNSNDELNFDGSDERLGVTGSSYIFVNWDEYPQSSNDYDVYLYDDNGNEIDRSTNLQDGSQRPLETVYASGCPCNLEIRRVNADGTADFDIFTYGADLQYSTAPRSVTRPATDEASITVGAFYYGDTDLEAFSSRGPTIDGRLKPEFGAPDGGSNSVYGNFFGTSQAAPHAAGAAALLQDANSSATPPDIEQWLKDTAAQTDSTYSSPDPNFNTGHGLINVSRAFQQMQGSPPTANDDSYATDEDTKLSVSAPGVLDNDTDPDGDSLTASLVSGPSNGSLTLNSDGSFDYTPDTNYNGQDSFTYEADDGTDGTDQATVSITVNAANDAPTASDDTYGFDGSSTLSVSAPGVLDNDDDVDGDSLSASVVSNPADGTLTLNSDGSFTYDPDASFSGEDTFSYEASDGNGGTDTATVTVRETLLDEQWSASTAGRVQYSSPTLDSDRVFIGGLDDTFYALFRANGSVDWTVDRSGSLADSSPALASGTVFVGSGGGVVYALDAATGTEQWSYTTDSAVVSSPAVNDSTVYVGSNDGTVAAINQGTGAEAWTYEAGEGVLSTIHVDSGIVFASTDDGQLIAIDESNGNEMWSIDRNADVGHSSPVVANGKVYFAADDIVVRDAGTGNAVTTISHSGTAGGSPVAVSGTVYVGSDTGTVRAIDTGSDSVTWSETVSGPVATQPAVAQDRVLVGSTDGTLSVLNASTGSVTKTVSYSNAVRSSPVISSDVVYVGTDGGLVVALENVAN